jgi:hypothetical protein
VSAGSAADVEAFGRAARLDVGDAVGTIGRDAVIVGLAGGGGIVTASDEAGIEATEQGIAPPVKHRAQEPQTSAHVGGGGGDGQITSSGQVAQLGQVGQSGYAGGDSRCPRFRRRCFPLALTIGVSGPRPGETESAVATRLGARYRWWRVGTDRAVGTGHTIETRWTLQAGVR